MQRQGKNMTARNCEIFEAHAAGEAIESLASRYGLRPETVRAILIREKHRRAVSLEPYYRGLRHAAQGGSIKNPEHEAETPAPMPEGAARAEKKSASKGPEKPTDLAGQQGGTHGGGRG